MATFAALQTRVLQIVIDAPTAVSAQVPTLINEAIRSLQRRHDFKTCERYTSVLTTTPATRLLSAHPSDWIKVRGRPTLITPQGVVRNLGWTEDRAGAERLYGTADGGQATTSEISGQPRVIVDFNSELLVYPLPDALSQYTNGNYRIRIPYYAYTTDLSAGSDNNWFTNNAEEWIAWSAAANAFGLNREEERGLYWEQKAANKLFEVIKLDKMQRLGSLTEISVSPNARDNPMFGASDYDRR